MVALQYGRSVPRVCVTPRRVVAAAVLCVGVYLCSYLAVRHSHTQWWFDKTTEERGAYTLFDAYTRGELCLYIVFWPACAADRAATGRPFEYDKW